MIMFSYYSIITNKCKNIVTKTIYPNNLNYISFLQMVDLNKNKFINNHNEKLYAYTNKRQDYILLNDGELEIDIYNKMLNVNKKLKLTKNKLFCNDNMIINEPILLNINASVFYNIKSKKKSNFLFYTSCYKDSYDNVNFEYYKISNENNNYNKYCDYDYPYFECSEKVYNL
jgi:hypothetical protein